MSWCDEQIRQRKESDQEVFEDSILRMASIVLGKRNAGILEDKRIVTKAAITKAQKSRTSSEIRTNSWNTVCARMA